MGFSWWLTLAFIVLKLTGYIDWNWWWVISPIVITISVLGLLNVLVSFLETDQDKRARRALEKFKKLSDLK